MFCCSIPQNFSPRGVPSPFVARANIESEVSRLLTRLRRAKEVNEAVRAFASYEFEGRGRQRDAAGGSASRPYQKSLSRPNETGRPQSRFDRQGKFRKLS